VRRAALLLAAAMALTSLSCGTGAAKTEDVATVRRDDLTLGVDVTGTLRAVESDLLGPPPIPDVWDFKIAFMAPEGATVKKGDQVLGFDDTELVHALQDKENELASVKTRIEKKLADAQMARRDEELKSAEA
jgi:multidrug efflux pump subunit AcrA (membrane-fusion protein)